MTLYCKECEMRVIPVDGVTAICQNGDWWCARCADVKYIDGYVNVVGHRGKLSAIDPEDKASTD